MPIRSLPLAISLVAACLLACGGNGDDDTDASSSTASAPGTTSDASTTASTGLAVSTGDSSTTTAATATTATTTTTADPTTTDPTTTGESTGPAPTDGPGVLPGETGLDAFCRRFFECGGTYYADAQACIDESLDYWGACPSRRTALDNFGACMSELECNTWSPDAYNPNSTPCADQWSEVGASEPCD